MKICSSRMEFFWGSDDWCFGGGRTVTDCTVQKSNWSHVCSVLYNHSLCLNIDKIVVCDCGWYFVNMLFSFTARNHLLPHVVIYPSLEYIFSPVYHIKHSWWDAVPYVFSYISVYYNFIYSPVSSLLYFIPWVSILLSRFCLLGMF
jgi:hypothetical protein